MTASDCYEYECGGELVRLDVHSDGVAHEPRIHWQVGEQTGAHGYIRLDTPEPVVLLEEGETARLAGRVVSEIPVPREIGEELDTAVEKLGAVVARSNRIADDPAAFPNEINGFEQIGWESERNVMWYWRDERSSPRAYQIERDKLVFRAQEWAEDSCSKYELIDQYGLDTTL